MEVRVVREQPMGGCPETDYVRVHTYSDPFDDTITLATIERVVEKANAAATRRAGRSEARKDSDHSRANVAERRARLGNELRRAQEDPRRLCRPEHSGRRNDG